MKRRKVITPLGGAAVVMTPAQASLIRKSFDEMWPIRRNLAVRFYDRFFEASPDARRLFPNDMEKQYLKLMDTIAALVGALDNHALFQSIIGHTARQHARFGVTSSQLAAFGDALIWSLEQQFGSAFTSELRQAWIALYEAIQTEMISSIQTEMISAGGIQA
jgi:hemoglobin-like flavoprotein